VLSPLRGLNPYCRAPVHLLSLRPLFSNPFGPIVMINRLMLAALLCTFAAPILADELQTPLMMDGAQPAASSAYDTLPISEELPLGGDPSTTAHQPLIEGYEPVGIPDWTRSPYRRSGWRFGIMPGISDDSDELIVRGNLGYENEDGTGKRAELWFYKDGIGYGFNSLDYLATTFYFDWYKRFFYHEAELLIGGGLALGHENFELGNRSNRFYGGGGGAVVEGFLPFLDGKRWDLGAVGRARVAGLVGTWDQEWGSRNEFDEWGMFVEEFGWGLEYRQQFGKNDGHFWYMNLMRELYHWSGADWPIDTDVLIEAVAFKFGVTW
jgi:hypothetical protein